MLRRLPHVPCAPRRAARAAGLALALVALAAGCEGGGGTANEGFTPKPVTVEVVEVRPELLRDVADLVGQLEAELTVQVRPDQAGLLETIEFAEGQRVEKGQVLFRLRDAEEAALLREAEAERDLKRVVYERTRSLTKQSISSRAQLDRAKAELDRETARVAAARAALERTRIRAPFDGIMGALFVSPGARVEPDDVLTQIDAIDRLQVLFTLPENAIARARPGIPFQFTVASFEGERFGGETYFVSPTLDPSSRRLLVKGWVPNSDHRLRPGQFANIRAEVGRREAALLVPEAALALDREGTFVWRVGEDDTAERVPVRTGLRVDSRVEIVSGLEPGDRVVSAGTNKVRAGSRIRAAGDPVSRLAGSEGEPGPTAAAEGEPGSTAAAEGEPGPTTAAGSGGTPGEGS